MQCNPETNFQQNLFQGWQQSGSNMCQPPDSIEWQNSRNDIRNDTEDDDGYSRSTSNRPSSIPRDELQRLLKDSIFIVDPKSELHGKIKNMLKESERVNISGKKNDSNKKRGSNNKSGSRIDDDSEESNENEDETQNIFQDAKYPTKNKKLDRNNKSSRLADIEESEEEQKAERKIPIKKRKKRHHKTEKKQKSKVDQSALLKEDNNMKEDKKISSNSSKDEILLESTDLENEDDSPDTFT
ncbi:hypothetical protein P3W45_001481 [Vairimorpha bombi]